MSGKFIAARRRFSSRWQTWIKPSIFILALGLLSTAYSDSSGSPKAPGMPEAYAFEDFSKSHTVDPVTGNMALTLPLYTVPTPGDLEYKIQLTYAAGIKTEQLASEVGLGWNINSPSFSRSVNGMPDDILNPSEDNYHYWKQLPAIYPAHIFKKQKEDLQFAKKQAQRKMIGDLVKTAALTAVTFGAGAALGGVDAVAKAAEAGNYLAKGVQAAQASYSGRALATATASTAYGAYQANNAAAKSLKGLKKQQDKIREMIDAETKESGTMKLNGKIYIDANSLDMSDMDYHNADSYFLNAPGFTTQLILLQPNESSGRYFFPTTFQSNIPHIDYGKPDLKDTESAPYNFPLVTVTENNMIGLIDTAGDPFEGYLFIDSQGRRYLFDTAIEWAKAVERHNMPGFIPPELEASFTLNEEGTFSTFSWRDHYPGGITNSPADLRDHEGSRMGAAEYLLQDHVLGWGLTRIQDGNKALHEKGNEIQFEYVEMEMNGDDDAFTVAETSASKTGGAYYTFDNGVYTTSPSGHKTLSRGFKKFKLLHKITSETHQAEFVYSYDREDGKEAFALSHSELDGKPKLQEIKMWAIQGDSQKLVSKYVFEYDYSLMYGAPDNQNANPIAAGASCGAGLDMCGRLTLKSLQYVSYASGSEAVMPKIEFTYANGDGPKTRDACDEDNLNWVTKCVLQNKDVDEELSDTANPRYLRGATDRWGYFFLPTSADNLHNEKGSSQNYIPEAWSLTNIVWPSGGTTGFSYEADAFQYVNDLDIKTTKYGGGLRISYVEQCDGMGNCYYDNYFYAGCHECIAEGGSGTEACGNLSGSNSQLAICDGLAACRVEESTCVCADPGAEDTLNCPVPFVPDGESSGYALGVPPATQHSLDFQQRGALQPAQDLPETLVQSSHFNVQYTQVVQYQSSEPQGEASWGMTVTEFTGPFDSMENEEGENVSLAGGGFWSPGRIFHAYDWKQSGSQSGGSEGYNAHAPHGDDYWVSFDRSIFVPKKGDDNYNYLQFKEAEKYYVAANSPGYLFWIKFNAGRDSCWGCSSRCAMHTRAQHPWGGSSGARPPFIGDSCPGNEQGMYCGTVEFENRGVNNWDWENGGSGIDCEEPGDILIFCPANAEGLIEDPSDANHNYNPYQQWQENVDWRGGGGVADKFDYGLADDGRWRTWVFPWNDVCYQVFGGHTDIGTDEKPQFNASAPSCVDNFTSNGNYTSDGNGVCDLSEHDALNYSMGKEIRPYALGLSKSIKKYHRDNLNTPKYIEENTFELQSYDALERSSIYVGKARLVSLTKTQDGVTATTHYSDFDAYTGLPGTTEVVADGESITTEVTYAYENVDGLGKKALNMLTLRGAETIRSTLDAAPTTKRTVYEYSNSWPDDGGESADQAWLLKKVSQDNFSGSDQEETFLAYDKWLHPLVVEDGNGNRTSYRYGDNDNPCGDGGESFGDDPDSLEYEEGVYVWNDTFSNSKITCIQNAMGHRKIYNYNEDYQLSKVINAQGLRTDFAYDDLGRLSEINVHKNNNDSAWDQKYEYGFMRDTGEPNVLKTFTRMDDAEMADAIYSDGMGRTLQARQRVSNDDSALVTNYFYNSRGFVSKAAKPKVASTLNYNSENISGDPDYYTEKSYHADPLGRVHREYPLGRSTAGGEDLEYLNHYGSEGNLAKKTIVDAKNNSSESYKTGLGHPAKHVDAQGHETSYATDGMGRITTVTDALARVSIENTYNSIGQLTERIRFPNSANAETTTYEYDGNGNLVAEMDDAFGTTIYTYDALNRLVKTDYPGDTPDVKNYYDGVEETGSCAGRQFDPYGCNVGDVSGDYGINILDIVQTVQIILGNIDNPSERELCAANFNGDALVNVLDIVSLVGYVLGNDYYMYSQDNPEWINYTSDGLLCRVQQCDEDDCSVSEASPFIAYNYDREGRIIGLQTSQGYTFYERTHTGQIERMHHPITDTRKRMDFTYDVGGRLTSVTIEGAGMFEYDYSIDNVDNEMAGHLKSITYPNEAVSRFYTTQRGFMGQTDLNNGEWADIYEYDRTGNIEVIASNDGIASFVYNSKNQLFSITNDGYYNGLEPSLIEYDYDAVGNRTTRYTQASWAGCYRDQILGEVYSYDTDTNRLNGTTVEDCQYDYDANGNLTGMNNCNAEIDEGTNSWNMVYDGENRLKEITVDNYCAGNFTETYSYDPLGRRTDKAQGNSHTSYIYGLNDQPLSVVFDEDTNVDNNDETTHYYYAQGRLLAKEQDGVMYYVHQDRLMSNRVETDSAGDIHAEMLATPFGHQLINGGIRMSFATGKELDDTGLYYFGDRFYDPSLGRFTSPDQLAEGRPFDSAYVYVGNNPMNRVDPDGNWWFLVTGAVSAVVDYGAQVATNCYSNPDGDWSEVLWDDVSMTSVAVSFGTGMVGGGISTLSKANKISKVTTTISKATVSATGSVANQALSGEGISVEKTFTDVLMGKVTEKVAKPVNGVLGELIESDAVSYTAQKMNSKLVSKTIGVLTADPGINDNNNDPIFPLVGGSNQGTSFGFSPAVQDNTYMAMPPQ